MWWLWIVIVVAVLAALVVVLQRRGSTGVDGDRAKDSTHEGQVGIPPGQWGDGGGF